LANEELSRIIAGLLTTNETADTEEKEPSLSQRQRSRSSQAASNVDKSNKRFFSSNDRFSTNIDVQLNTEEQEILANSFISDDSLISNDSDKI